MSPLIYLNYPIDKQQLLEEAGYIKRQALPYTDPRYNRTFPNWLMCKHMSNYTKQIMKDFEVIGKPRFYWLAPNAVIPEHTDNGPTCSINFVLSDGIAPVTVEGVDYFYTQALLNTSVLHSVTNGAQERVLFKISLFNISYEQMCQSIKFKKVE